MKPAAMGDRYFEAISEPNFGYVFRVRKCNSTNEWNLSSDYDSGVPCGDLYRIECVVKGYFDLGNQWDGKTTRLWGSICYEGANADGLIETSRITSDAELTHWLSTVVGPVKEIASHGLGKWSPGREMTALKAFETWPQEPFEAWAVMFEQQFASLFSLISTFTSSTVIQRTYEKLFIGYREWIHFANPLGDPMRILHMVPEDWDSKLYWDEWRVGGALGEVLFDVWARDFDHWWLDTFRKKGLTLNVVPSDRHAFWTPETDLDVAVQSVLQKKEGIKELPILTSSYELKDGLLSNLNIQEDLDTDLDEIRRKIYGPWIFPFDYSIYNVFLPVILRQLDFFNRAEGLMASKRSGIVISPIAGRTLVV